MLQSAVSYCRSAQLPLDLVNEDGDLVVRIKGVQGHTGPDGITRFALAHPVTSVAPAPEVETEAA